ncbi:Uma2 family endonuclease [Streptomyces sparsus]
MAAEPGDPRSGRPLPAWTCPPPNGWIADDLDRPPPSAPRCELVDGILVTPSPQTYFHSTVKRRLAHAREIAAPGDLRVVVGMTVRLGERQRPEPDVLVVNTAPATTRTAFTPDEVELAVEIVSAESRERDRRTKPQRYAEAGIRHFWRVERERDDSGSGQDAPVAHVYELDDTTGDYVPTGIHRGRTAVPVPFPVDIDLGTLYRR